MNTVRMLYEDTDHCTETYEYAYAHDHQYECLHWDSLLSI